MKLPRITATESRFFLTSVINCILELIDKLFWDSLANNNIGVVGFFKPFSKVVIDEKGNSSF